MSRRYLFAAQWFSLGLVLASCRATAPAVGLAVFDYGTEGDPVLQMAEPYNTRHSSDHHSEYDRARV
jgi:hypothetical protein